MIVEFRVIVAVVFTREMYRKTEGVIYGLKSRKKNLGQFQKELHEISLVEFIEESVEKHLQNLWNETLWIILNAYSVNIRLSTKQ